MRSKNGGVEEKSLKFSQFFLDSIIPQYSVYHKLVNHIFFIVIKSII